MTYTISPFLSPQLDLYPFSVSKTFTHASNDNEDNGLLWYGTIHLAQWGVFKRITGANLRENLKIFWGSLQENGYVERFQRTIQEYFIDAYSLDSTYIDEFNKQMMLFLLWYNASRPHTGLNRDFPLEFILMQYGKSPMESQMLWNYTQIWQVYLFSLKSIKQYKDLWTISLFYRH